MYDQVKFPSVSELLEYKAMADFSVQYPENEGIVTERLPNINLLMDSVITSMSEMARERLLDPHDAEGKLIRI